MAERQEINDLRELLKAAQKQNEFVNGTLGLVYVFEDLYIKHGLNFSSSYPKFKTLIGNKNVLNGIKLFRFVNCKIQDEIIIRYEKSIVEFKNCCLRRLRLTNVENDVNLQNNVILTLDCREASFGSKNSPTKLYVHQCQLSRTNFDNAKFYGLVDFWRTKFYKRTIFYKTDFNATAVFSMAAFEKNVLFTYSLLAGKSIFSKTEFRAGLDFSQAIISGELKLFDLQFENEEFNTKYFDKKNKEGYQNAIDHKGIIPTENKVHTFQILRKAFEDAGNFDDATEMRRAEKRAQRQLNLKLYKELAEADNNEKSRFQTVVDWLKAKLTFGWRDFFTNDGVILLFNRLSNKYRTSFWRGVAFTFLIASLFLTLTLNITDSYSFTFDITQWQWEKLIIFLNPAHSIKDVITNPGIGSYIFDYLGRIFVGYGIYQTVQAFRKFK